MIRPVRSTDIPELVELGRSMHQLGIYADYNFDPAKLASHVKKFTISPDAMGFVYVKDGKVEGAILGYLDRHYFGHDLIAVQSGFFIQPESRGGLAAIRLMKAFHRWAKDHDVSCIVFATSQAGKDDRWLKFCENMGYEHVGYVFHMKTI
jgi:GNAT superfamily N-acetyltransferase